MLTCVITFL